MGIIIDLRTFRIPVLSCNTRPYTEFMRLEKKKQENTKCYSPLHFAEEGGKGGGEEFEDHELSH